MIRLRAMDYDNKDLLTIQMDIGPPTDTSIKVFNNLGQELVVDRIVIDIDERNGTYETTITTVAGTRTASIVGIEHDGQATQTQSV